MHESSLGSTAFMVAATNATQGAKASTLICLYWRMLPNSRITAPDCTLIGEIRLQNGDSAMTGGGSCSAFLGLGQICRFVLSFAWGIALIARQL